MMWKLQGIEQNLPDKCFLSIYRKIKLLLHFCFELCKMKMKSMGFKCYVHEVEECCAKVIKCLVQIS